MSTKKRAKGRKYTEKALYSERSKGFYWYSALWKILRPVMVFLCALAIVAGLVSSGWRKVYEDFFSPVDETALETETFVIESGSSVTTVGRNLFEKGLIKNRGLFGYIIQFRGLTSSIQYGNYELSRSMTMFDIIDTLSSGSATTERTITIIPGWTLEDIADYLVEKGAAANREEFLDLCSQPELFIDSSYALQTAKAESDFKNRLYALEGYLAPDTYRIFINASVQSVITKLLGQTDKVLDKLIYASDTTIAYDENGNIIEVTDASKQYKTTLTPEETVILASMIEKEAGNKNDYARISAVFHNRLNRGMKLESDATVSYVLKLKRLALTSGELSVASPYNTYIVSGLPAGPICSPSAAAIEAALYPDMEYINDGYLYFCAKEPESGETAFARTYEEHLANVERYRPSWIEYDNRIKADSQ